MSRHAHRHSRITRIINARHQREADEEDVDDGPQPNSYEVGTVQNPMVSADPLSSIKPCDPLQNTTCPEELTDVTDLTENLLGKRQAESTAEAVQTIIQVEGSYSQTFWQATATESPMTVSDSISAQVTFSGSSATTDLLPATSPADFTTTQPVASSSSTQSTTTSKPLVPVSSPRVSPASSSRHHSSTPLNSVASSTTTASTSYATTSVYYSSSSSTTSYYWSNTVQSSSTTTGFDGGAVQTGTTTGSGTGSGSGSSTNNGSSGSISPTTSKIVGGVVGSVAGLAVLFLLLFYILRQRGYLDRFFKGKGTQTLPSSDMGAAGSREMYESERPSSMFPASYLAPAFMKRWRQSTMTTRTDSTIDSGSSERGFQKISGRKIPPVLTHGGDGFGGGLEGDSPTIPDCLIGLSPASAGQGPLSPPTNRPPPPTSPFGSPLDANYTREADEISPARPPKVQLPVSSSVNFGSPTAVNPTYPLAQPQSAIPVNRTDAVGRSHPSHDGSRGSRFTESLDM